MENSFNTPDTSLRNSQHKDSKNDSATTLNPHFDDLTNPETIKTHIEDLKQQGNSKDNLNTILATREKLKLIKATDIKFSEPVLMQGDNAVIFPHTINVIQGQAGVHKSRLAENICSAFLKRKGCDNHLLGFNSLNYNGTHTVVYVDTERNLTEQLPFALQSIQLNAGYNKADHPANFEYISLLQINRKERFTALNDYLSYLKKTINTPLFIVLDVSTDCIEDFNKTDKSMELIDLMNMAINEHNVIFLCLIHENPNSDKARGHFGTELMNKASTVMQVSFEKDANQQNTDIIRVKYLKCRSTARHTPFHIKYCNDIGGLILATAEDVSTVVNNRKHKAGNDDIIEHLQMYLGDGTSLNRTELLNKLCEDFNASNRTVETRLKEIVNEVIIIKDNSQYPCILDKQKEGKQIIYKLLRFKDN